MLSHDEVVHEKGSMIDKMPGGYEDKFSNLRTSFGYMMTHPGKKLLFMGQEFAQFKEFNESDELDWSLFEFDAHTYVQDYMKALNRLYQTEPALYQLDDSPEGFAWINETDANRSLLSFERRGRNEKDTLVIICNFTPVTHKNYKLAVPTEGRWKEIFSSDAARFGGEGFNNKSAKDSRNVAQDKAAVKPVKKNRSKSAKTEEILDTTPQLIDGRENYISVTVPGLSISVFKKMAVKKTAADPAKKAE